MSITTALPLTTGPAVDVSKPVRSALRWCLRAITTTAAVLVAIAAALAIILAVASRMSPSGQAVVFGHPVMSMLSGSMTGTINTGDFIVDDSVTPAQAQQLQVGQIATFRETAGSATFITHRIVGVKLVDGAVYYTTKGDANSAADAALRPATDVVGLYHFSVPRGGYVLAALHQPRTLFMLLVSVALFFFIGPLFRMVTKAMRQEV